MSLPAPDSLKVDHDGSVLRLTLNRPDVRNAIFPGMIAELAAVLDVATAQPPRVVILAGAGGVFCSGADLNWMRSSAGFSHAENHADALAFADMLQALNQLPCPVVCRVQGGAFGGALGLMACCDSVICAEDAVFAFSEVRLGISPATIAPYVVAKIGSSAARELFLSATRFDAATAKAIGLAHQIVPAAELDASVDKKVADMLAGGPMAQAATKRLLSELTAFDEGLRRQTAGLIADLRASAEGQEGLSAFLEKRQPSWKV